MNKLNEQQSIDQIVDLRDLTKLNHALNVGYEAIEYKIKTLTELLPVLYEARQMIVSDDYDEEEFHRNEIEIKEANEDIQSLELMLKSKEHLTKIAKQLQPEFNFPNRILKKYNEAVDLVIRDYEIWIESLNIIENDSPKFIETRNKRIIEFNSKIEYFKECKDYR